MDSIQRGQRAEAILNDPIYTEAYETVETALMDQWRESKSPDEREAIYNSVIGLQRAKYVLEQYMQSGEYDKELKEKYEDG